jgi:hypothetical protein
MSLHNVNFIFPDQGNYPIANKQVQDPFYPFLVWNVFMEEKHDGYKSHIRLSFTGNIKPDGLVRIRALIFDGNQMVEGLETSLFHIDLNKPDGFVTWPCVWSPNHRVTVKITEMIFDFNL